MNTAESPSDFTRVVVAIGAAMRGRAALRAGVDLAAAVNAALEGLFVENAELLRVSALPSALETSTLTGARRRLVLDELERAFRVAAARAERELAEEAARMRVAWSFAVARGELWATALARDAELIVVETPALSASRSGPTRAGGLLLTVFDASPSARRGLAAITRLARTSGGELAILVSSANGAAGRSARSEAEDWLTAQRARGRTLPVRLERGEVMTTAHSRRGALLVLPEPLASTWSGDVISVADAAPCPLVIAR